MAAPTAPPVATTTAPVAPFKKKRVVVAAERWRASRATVGAAVALKRFYKVIEAPSAIDSPEADSAEEVVYSVGALQKAAMLFMTAADPTDGLLAELFRVKESVPLAILKALGADAVQRATSVDKALARFLERAVKLPHGEAPSLLSRVPVQLRTLLALRFFALSDFDFCLAAENLQSGLENILSDEVMEACDGEPGDRNTSVDDFGMAMEILRGMMPDGKVLQRALDATLAHRRMPAECLKALEEMSDDGVCPDLSWLYELEVPVEEKDDEEEEEEEDEEEDEE